MVIHHLPPTYPTIVDLLSDDNIQDLLPTVDRETQSYWPLLMCDHIGNMGITLVALNDSQPITLPLNSPHSDTIRAVVTHRSLLYSCSDDGQLVQWQPPSSKKNFNENQQQTKSNSRKPY